MQDEQHLEPVREPVRALERVGGVGVEEAAAVVAELLDRLLRRERPEGDCLLGPFERGDRVRSGQGLRDALRHEDDGGHEGDRQEDVDRRPGQVDPEVADRGRGSTDQPAGQGDRDRHAGSRRGEVLDGEARSLRQVGHRRLTRVVLPVRVRDEADRGIEAQELLDRTQIGLVERQAALDALEQVEHHDGHEAERQDADRVGLPALLGRLIDAGYLVDRALDGAEDGRQDRPACPRRRETCSARGTGVMRRTAANRLTAVRISVRLMRWAPCRT